VNNVARVEDSGRDFREKYFRILRYIISTENHKQCGEMYV
jgi:hypothetical protein